MFKNIWVLLALFVPTLAASYLAITIYSNGNVQPTDITKESLDFTFTYFSKPIVVFSLVIPCLTFAISRLRYEQSQKQIRQSQELFVFNNYLEHLKSFKELVKSVNGLSKRLEEPKIYNLMYPEARKGCFDLNKFQDVFFEDIKKSLDDIREFTTRKPRKNEPDQGSFFVGLSQIYEERFDKYGVHLECKGCSEMVNNMKTIVNDVSYLIGSDYFSKTPLTKELKGALELFERADSGGIERHVLEHFLAYDFSSGVDYHPIEFY
ncbi:hypothetical protein AB6D89_21175 [Vibrio splendidus]